MANCHTPEKAAFATRKQAKIALKGVQARFNVKRLTAYKCECGMYHLTTPRRKHG